MTVGETTMVNFTASDIAGGYTFHGDSAEVRTCTPGDVNGDGNISPADATDAFSLFLNKDCEEFTAGELCVADVNDSGCITPADATIIFQMYLDQ
jgi:hypothetical protein